MKTVKGIFTDCNLIDTPPGYSPFIKNAILTDKLGSIITERGFNIFANVPYTIIGIEVVQNVIFVFHTNNTLSEIGKIDSAGVYTKIINDNDVTPSGSKFNFNTAFPIDAESYKDTRGHVVIAWIEDNNTPKIIDTVTPAVQFNDYELFPLGNTPIPQVSVSDTGGSLPSGVYRVLYNYEDSDGSQSDYSVTSQPVSIIPGLSNAGDLPFAGLPAAVTTKSLLITVQPGDPNWKYINIVVVKNINNQISVARVKQVPNKLSTYGVFTEVGAIDVNYSGTEVETPMLLETILNRNARYLNAKAIGQLNNKLYLANLTADEEILLQKYCTGATAKWVSNLPGGGSANIKNDTAFSVNSWKYSTFAHGEVYALYLQFRIKQTGVWTKNFHLPGRAINPGDDNIIAPAPIGVYKSGTGSPTFKLFQLEDTCSMTSVNVTTLSSEGTMGYWENANENYPDDPQFNGVDISVPGGRDLRNQKVLHHKFPTIRYMKNIYKAANGFLANTYGNILDVLTLKVDLGNAFNEAYVGPGKVPQDILDKIDGWRLVYAKRDLNNATVLGTSQIFFYGRGESSNEYKPLAANTQESSEGVNDDIMLNRDSSLDAKPANYIRYHAFNLMVDKPNVAPSYLRQELKFRYDNTGDATDDDDPRLVTDTANNSAAVRKWSLFNEDTYAFPEMTEPGMSGFAPRAADNDYRFRNVEFLRYMPASGVVSDDGSTLNNAGGEEHVLLKQNVQGLSLDDRTMELPPELPHTKQYWIDTMEHKTYLSSLCVIRSNVYNSFLAQPLVACDVEAKREQTVGPDYVLPQVWTFGGGDNWIGPHSVLLTGPHADNAIVSDVGRELEGEGCKSINVFYCDSPKNCNYRYQSDDVQSQFYPKTDMFPKILDADWSTRYLGLQNLMKPPLYLYDNTFNTRNDLITSGVFDPEVESETQFPNTVIASEIQSTDTEKISWRTFLAGNRYVMPRDKGAIINLQGVGNQRLYIHQEDGLFLTKDRTTLKGDVVSITLGSGNIFDVTPYEVVSTEDGYAGTQHKFGCVLTKLGYAFVDTKQAKIFIHNGEKLDEISAKGLRQFLLEHINGALPDNPFQGNGITIGYDEQFNRLIVTINDSANSKFITLSYSPQLESWVSFHDYDPSFLLTMQGKRLFSVKNNNQIFEHNVGPYGRYYQVDSARFPMIIDVPFNMDPYVTKYFSSVEWTSQAYNGNIFIPQETFSALTVRSGTKATGKILLSQFNNLGDIYTSNTRNIESTWKFNEIRNLAVQIPTTGLTLDFYNNYEINPAAIDLTKDWYERGQMVDDFVICRFEYNNLSNYQLTLLDHKVNMRKSYR